MSELQLFKAADWKPGKEGIFFDLPEQTYRRAEGISQSSLKPLAASPKKYAWALENPKPRTPEMAFGSVVHAMCLEPERLAQYVVLRPEEFDSYRTKAAKEWRAQQTAIPVVGSELAKMRAAADAVKNDPKAGWILDRAQKEVSVFKRDEATGLLLKGRLDLPFQDLEDKTAIADIKKVASVRESLFANAIGEHLYHLQGAFYMDLIGASSFYFICVEEEAPHEVDVFQLTAASISRGRALYEHLLLLLKKCRDEDRWPGISDDSNVIKQIEEPMWARRNLSNL